MIRLLPLAIACMAAFAPRQDKALRITLVPQDAAVAYQTQLLGEMDRPVGDGLTVGGVKRPAKLDERGKLEIDVKGDGKFRTIAAKREIVSFELKGEKTLKAKFELKKTEKGEWVVRNLTQLVAQIGSEQFVIVDANGNGVYNEAGVDGMAWAGQTWLFPLPAPEERWCSASMEFTGLTFGALGESPKVSGKALSTAVAAALPVLKGVNEERVKLGLTPRPEDVKLSAELQKHCAYMALNNTLTHPEEKGKPGYSEEGHLAGMRSILSRGTPAEGVALGMVNTYFHRQDVIRPNTLAFGVGYEGAFGGIDGRTSMDKTFRGPVLCPVPGQTGVGLAYGKEAPDACPGDAAAGYPITVYFGTPRLKLKTQSLKALAPAGATAVDCYLYDPTQGASADFTRFQHAVCLIAKDPLKPNTTYEVALEVDVDGQPWSKTWRFTTGAGDLGRMR